MEFIGPPQTRAEADAAIDRQNGFLDRLGYCFRAIERREDGALLGFCGLKPGAAGTPIEGEVEIGWRLGRSHWGSGYAREAAEASLGWGWAHLDVPTIAAITTVDNFRSQRLMKRLGMQRAPKGDFDHPEAIERLRGHVTYRIARGAVNPV
jgi:RimJ/RimL family protein N-acetyltransferase